MSLPESLERAATELTRLADQIRPANGDPDRLLDELDLHEARELLAWILVHEFDSAEELVTTWGETEEGAEVLIGVTEESVGQSIGAAAGISKAARKLLRRAHHRLRSRGIEVEPAAVIQGAPRRVAVVEDAFEAALLSSPDFRGTRVAYLVDRHPAGGARLFEIRFDEGRGILDFKVYNAGRSKVRGFLRSLSSAQAERLFDVSRTALCALIRRSSLAQPVDRPLPSGFVEWRGRLFPESLEKESTPGGLVRAAWAKSGESVETEAAVEAVVAAIEDGGVGPWPPATRWVGEWMDRAREAVEGVSGEALDPAIQGWRSAVAQELADEMDGMLLARHLEEAAWVRWQVDGLAAAANLIATADAVREDEKSRLRVAEARVDSLFAPFVQELRTRASATSEADTGE